MQKRKIQNQKKRKKTVENNKKKEAVSGIPVTGEVIQLKLEKLSIMDDMVRGPARLDHVIKLRPPHSRHRAGDEQHNSKKENSIRHWKASRGERKRERDRGLQMSRSSTTPVSERPQGPAFIARPRWLLTHVTRPVGQKIPAPCPITCHVVRNSRCPPPRLSWTRPEPEGTTVRPSRTPSPIKHGSVRSSQW